MSTCRSSAVSVISPNADPPHDSLADVDPADLDRFVRHLAEAAASWHRRRQAAPVPLSSADLPDLPRVA
jgi:hypothetical protein